MKFRVIEKRSGKTGEFWCPGCRRIHRVPVTDETYNGDPRNPTVSGMVTYAEGGLVVCRARIQSGYLAYTMECRHQLAGQRVPMRELSGVLPK